MSILNGLFMFVCVSKRETLDPYRGTIVGLFKGIFHQKWTFCHYLVTLMFFGGFVCLFKRVWCSFFCRVLKKEHLNYCSPCCFCIDNKWERKLLSFKKNTKTPLKYHKSGTMPLQQLCVADFLLKFYSLKILGTFMRCQIHEQIILSSFTKQMIP